MMPGTLRFQPATPTLRPSIPWRQDEGGYPRLFCAPRTATSMRTRKAKMRIMFITNTVSPADCDIYSFVRGLDRSLSNRHLLRSLSVGSIEQPKNILEET